MLDHLLVQTGAEGSGMSALKDINNNKFRKHEGLVVEGDSAVGWVISGCYENSRCQNDFLEAKFLGE